MIEKTERRKWGGFDMGALSKAILACVAKNPGGISTSEVREYIGRHHPDLKWEKSACSNLASKRHLVNGNGKQGLPTKWYLPAEWEALQEKKEAEKGPYNWLEKPTGKRPISKDPLVIPKTTPAREDALVAFSKDCPSRTGDKFTSYTGPRAMCVGPGLGIYGPGRAGSAQRG